MIVKHATVALALLLAQASNAVPNMVKVKNCNNNGRKCSLDTAGFNVKNRPKDEVSQIDLGNGRAYACKSTGPPRGRGAMFHAECTSSAEAGGGKGKDKGQGQRKVKGQGGAMNAITRGKNSMGQDLLFATVNVDGEICKIHPDENGEESVVDCTPEAEFPDEGDPEEPLEEKMVYAPGHDATGGRKFRELVTDPVDEKLKRSPVPGLRGRGQHRGLVDDEGGNIDTMVVWTKHSECMNSGLPRGCERTEATENNMRAMIDLAIAETNTAYELSGIFTELRLVKAYCDETYTEASSNAFNAALYSIKGTTDGVMDDVHANRTKYGADIVAMIIDDSQYCGLAFSGPPSYERMFSVTKWSCATGYYSFGHEIGHNMGCYHDKGTMNQCTSSNYNYGWRDPQAQFRSILAYGCTTGECDNNAGNSCSRVQRFSNPTYTYDNKAIGSAEVDNARQINDVRHTIAAFETFVRDCQTASDCDDNDPCTDNGSLTPKATADLRLSGKSSGANLKLPSYLSALDESDPEWDLYSDLLTSPYVVGDPGQGNIVPGQVEIVRFVEPHFVFRTYGGGAKQCRYWWTMDPPTGSKDTYFKHFAICPEWNDASDIIRCRVPVGYVTAVGVGQTVDCPESGGHLAPDPWNLQMNGDICMASLKMEDHLSCVYCSSNVFEMGKSSCSNEGPSYIDGFEFGGN